MKTNLNRQILSIEDAKAYLRELARNNEDYHPDDSADTIIWERGLAPDANECALLDALMDACRDFLDPCEELLALDHKDKVYQVTSSKESAILDGYSLYLSGITDEDFGEYMNIGEIGDEFENHSFKIIRTK